MQNVHSNESRSLAKALDHHFAACAAAAIAVGAMAVTAQGAIVYSGPLDLLMQNPGGPFTANPTATINLPSLAAEVNPALALGAEIYLRTSTTNLGVSYFFSDFDTRFAGHVDGTNIIERMTAGESIGGPTNFVTSGYLSYGKIYYGVPDPLNRNCEWNGNSTDGFMGFRVNMPDGLHYGWVRMDIVQGTNEGERLAWKITIRDVAYESSPGVPIIAGDVGVVPEPAGAALGLLALGAIGVRPNRRKIA